MAAATRDVGTYTALKECRPQSWGPLRTMTAVDTYAGGTGQADSTSYPVLEGRGTLHSRMGYEFTGVLHDGEAAGAGVQRWRDGRTVSGSFEHGTVAGSGSLHWPNGDVYTGHLRESVRHGRGTLVSDGGKSRYSGDWHLGKRHGRGTQEYPDGSVYDGEWQHNTRHGHGRLRYSTGDIFEGAWREDTRSGTGVMGWVDASGGFYKELYRGEWSDGRPDGAGVSVYTTMPTERPVEQPPRTLVAPSHYAAPAEALLNVYVGEYQRGQRHGRGTLYYADGSCYEGDWAAGEQSGAGRFTSAVGEVQAASPAAKPAAAAEQAAAGWTRDQTPPSVVPTVSPQGLGSLLETEEDLHSTVHLLLLRYNTTLKTLFKNYSHRSAHVALPTTRDDWWQQRLPGRLTLTQCLCLLHDAGVLGSHFSIGAALRAVADVLRIEAETWPGAAAPSSVAASLAAANEAAGTLNYRQFCEWLIRVAVAANGGPTRTTVKEKVSGMLDGPLSATPAAPPRAVATSFLPVSQQRRADVQRHLGVLKRCYAELQSVKDGCRYGVSVRSCLAAMAQTLIRCGLTPADVVEKLAWLRDDSASGGDRDGGAAVGADSPSLAQETIASAIAKNRQVRQLDEDAGAEQSFVEFVETIMVVVQAAQERGVGDADALLLDLKRHLFA